MENTGFNITIPYLFSPISAFNAENKPYIIRFNVHETFQINQLNSKTFNNTFVQFL